MFIKKYTASSVRHFSILMLIMSLVIISSGCQKKTEQPGNENKDTTKVVTPTQPNTDTTAQADTTKKYPDLTGIWKGTFDKRPTTLSIKEQNGENFKGSMTIPYKQPLNKEVSGKIKTDNQITMKDLVHSRYMGNYIGKISDDGKKISGTFTMNSNNSTKSFEFKKQ